MIAVIDRRQPDAVITELRRHGMTVVALPPFPTLAEPVASHPDMLLLRIGRHLLVHKDYYRIASSQIDNIIAISGLKLVACDDNIGPEYPRDVIFNAAVIGNRLFCRAGALSKSAHQLAVSDGIEVIDVRQGYAKCSTCIVSELAVITSDRGIAAATAAHGIDVLTIRPGHIRLPGYPTGFIGGAGGTDGRHVYFSGSLDTHPDANSIRRFCADHGRQAVSLSDGELFDGGTIMII